MNKKIIYGVISLLAIVGLFFAVKSIRYEHYPAPLEPSAEWKPFVNSLDAQHEAFFVDANGVKLEAELFIPNGGQEQKPAVVFSPGSGDSLYQNYAWGLVETYVLDVFLSHDFAMLLVNKRGMEQSEGNYVKNSIGGRAEDIYAAVESLKGHPKIDAENIGLIGHSQGGWVVVQAAAEHPDIAFFISLAGLATTMRENAADNSDHQGRCQGLQGEDLDAYISKRAKMVDLSISIGELTNFGFFGFDARNMGYDPREALQTVQNPGLFIYAENDDQVTPSLSIDRMNEIFNNYVPENFEMLVMDDATHAFRLVNDPCESWVNVEEQEQSEQLVGVLHAWLAEQGY
jgi:hypothetical protein